MPMEGSAMLNVRQLLECVQSSIESPLDGIMQENAGLRRKEVRAMPMEASAMLNVRQLLECVRSIIESPPDGIMQGTSNRLRGCAGAF